MHRSFLRECERRTLRRWRYRHIEERVLRDTHEAYAEFAGRLFTREIQPRSQQPRCAKEPMIAQTAR